MKQQMKNITFRLELSLLERFDEEAAAKRLNRSEYLRELITEHMFGEDDDRAQQQLDQLHADLIALRKNLATACAKLLVTDGKIDAETARKWVRQNLLK